MRRDMNHMTSNRNTIRIFFLSIFYCVFFANLSFAAVLSTDPVETLSSSGSSESPAAKLVSFEGDVKILKKGSENWLQAEKDQAIQVGDQILVGKGSSADIAYDSYFLNISHLKENTKAEIRSINPTDIYLEDGSIFSALDGLSSQSGYQIATPTAVAAVRGTHFDVDFDKANQKFTAASLPSGEEGHVSKIFVLDPEDPDAEGVEVIENKQLDLKSGDMIRPELIRTADPMRMEAGKKMFAQMGERLPRFQELRGEGKVRLQEMKQRGPQRPDGQKPPFGQKNELDSITPEKVKELFKEKPGNFKKSNPDGEINPPQPETPQVDSLENVRTLDAMLEEDKPQQAKPFGSFRPQRQEFGENNSRPQSPGPNGENQNTGQAQPFGKTKPFGEYRPQSINSGPNAGNFGRPDAMKPHPGGPQQGQGPQPQQGGGQKPQQPQGQRQGPPPQGPPKK